MPDSWLYGSHEGSFLYACSAIMALPMTNLRELLKIRLVIQCLQELDAYTLDLHRSPQVMRQY